MSEAWRDFAASTGEYHLVRGTLKAPNTATNVLGFQCLYLLCYWMNHLNPCPSDISRHPFYDLSQDHLCPFYFPNWKQRGDRWYHETPVNIIEEFLWGHGQDRNRRDRLVVCYSPWRFQENFHRFGVISKMCLLSISPSWSSKKSMTITKWRVIELAMLTLKSTQLRSVFVNFHFIYSWILGQYANYDWIIINHLCRNKCQTLRTNLFNVTF